MICSFYTMEQVLRDLYSHFKRSGYSASPPASYFGSKVPSIGLTLLSAFINLHWGLPSDQVNLAFEVTLPLLLFLDYILPQVLVKVNSILSSFEKNRLKSSYNTKLNILSTAYYTKSCFTLFSSCIIFGFSV